MFPGQKNVHHIPRLSLHCTQEDRTIRKSSLSLQSCLTRKFLNKSRPSRRRSGTRSKHLVLLRQNGPSRMRSVLGTAWTGGLCQQFLCCICSALLIGMAGLHLSFTEKHANSLDQSKCWVNLPTLQSVLRLMLSKYQQCSYPRTNRRPQPDRLPLQLGFDNLLLVLRRR